jgi:DNA-binding CsgD family transcriptional regulator
MNIKLTRREEQVLKLILAGFTLKETGQLLGLEQNTIHSCKDRIKRKWNVRTQTELVVKSIREGYLDIEEDEPITIADLYRRRRVPHSVLPPDAGPACCMDHHPGKGLGVYVHCTFCYGRKPHYTGQ